MLGGPAQAWCAVALKGTFCFISHWSLLCCAQTGGAAGSGGDGGVGGPGEARPVWAPKQLRSRKDLGLGPPQQAAGSCWASLSRMGLETRACFRT